jgi:bifunctional non-homologous end joining protein LigD
MGGVSAPSQAVGSLAGTPKPAIKLEGKSPITAATTPSTVGDHRVFIDWSQNDAHKTTVTVYSLRAKDHPTVSSPVHWEEIKSALAKRKPALLQFEAEEVLKRVRRLGDLFAPVLSTRQTLPPLTALNR